MLRFLRIPAAEDLQGEAEAASPVETLNQEAVEIQDPQVPETEEEGEDLQIPATEAEGEDPRNLLKVVKADRREQEEVAKRTLKVL